GGPAGRVPAAVREVRAAPLSGFISIAAIVIVAALVLLLLFEPGLPYRVAPSRESLGSREFVNYLSAIVNARLFATGALQGLNSGAAIYAAQGEAVAAAKKSTHLGGVLFSPGAAGAGARRGSGGGRRGGAWRCASSWIASAA